MNDRTGQALGCGTFPIAGKDEPVKIEIGQVRQYLKDVARVKKEEDEQAFIDLHFDLAFKLLKQGQPERSDKEINYLIEFNANDILRFLSVALKLTTKEKVLKDEELRLKQEEAEKKKNI